MRSFVASLNSLAIATPSCNPARTATPSGRFGHHRGGHRFAESRPSPGMTPPMMPERATAAPRPKIIPSAWRRVRRRFTLGAGRRGAPQRYRRVGRPHRQNQPGGEHTIATPGRKNSGSCRDGRVMMNGITDGGRARAPEFPQIKRTTPRNGSAEQGWTRNATGCRIHNGVELRTGTRRR